MRMTIAALAAAALPTAALAQYEPPVPEHAQEGEAAYEFLVPEKSPPQVFFLNLRDGATVSSPVRVEMGMLGLMIAPAGEETEYLSGHHHLLIDRGLDSIAADEPLPSEEDLLHFGDGATVAEVELAPGPHTLMLVAGDANHIPLDPMVASEPVTIIVAE